MARKKTISISRKPSAETNAPTGFEPPVTTSPTALALNLEPHYESLLDSPETRAALSTLAYGPLGLAVYNSVFCLSYSMVFSAILLGKFIPGSGLVRQGLHDGANAAQRSFDPKP